MTATAKLTQIPVITRTTRFRIPSVYGKVVFKLKGTHMSGGDLHYDLLDANEKSKVPIHYDIAEKAIRVYAERNAIFFGVVK